jgi:hypothetical protein
MTMHKGISLLRANSQSVPKPSQPFSLWAISELHFSSRLRALSPNRLWETPKFVTRPGHLHDRRNTGVQSGIGPTPVNLRRYLASLQHDSSQNKSLLYWSCQRPPALTTLWMSNIEIKFGIKINPSVRKLAQVTRPNKSEPLRRHTQEQEFHQCRMMVLIGVRFSGQ